MRTILAALMLMTPMAARADPAAVIYGIGGSESCAKWLSSPLIRSQGFTWVMGYWSGRNIQGSIDGGPDDSNHAGTVGSGVDGEGLVGEIELLCRGQPSMTLALATAQVYYRFQQRTH